jgi:hypothetical protein
MTSTEKVNIIDGPGKWDFATSFFTKIEDSNRNKVFTIEPNASVLILELSAREKVKLQIKFLEVLDSQAEKFSIAGVLMKQKESPTWMSRFEGYYDTRTRQGAIELKPMN